MSVALGKRPADVSPDEDLKRARTLEEKECSKMEETPDLSEFFATYTIPARTPAVWCKELRSYLGTSCPAACDSQIAGELLSRALFGGTCHSIFISYFKHALSLGLIRPTCAVDVLCDTISAEGVSEICVLLPLLRQALLSLLAGCRTHDGKSLSVLIVRVAALSAQGIQRGVQELLGNVGSSRGRFGVDAGNPCARHLLDCLQEEQHEDIVEMVLESISVFDDLFNSSSAFLLLLAGVYEDPETASAMRTCLDAAAQVLAAHTQMAESSGGVGTVARRLRALWPMLAGLARPSRVAVQAIEAAVGPVKGTFGSGAAARVLTLLMLEYHSLSSPWDRDFDVVAVAVRNLCAVHELSRAALLAEVWRAALTAVRMQVKESRLQFHGDTLIFATLQYFAPNVVRAILEDGKSEMSDGQLLSEHEATVEGSLAAVIPYTYLCDRSLALVLGGCVNVGLLSMDKARARVPTPDMPLFERTLLQKDGTAGPSVKACADLLSHLGFNGEVFERLPALHGVTPPGRPYSQVAGELVLRCFQPDCAKHAVDGVCLVLEAYTGQKEAWGGHLSLVLAMLGDTVTAVAADAASHGSSFAAALGDMVRRAPGSGDRMVADGVLVAAALWGRAPRFLTALVGACQATCGESPLADEDLPAAHTVFGRAILTLTALLDRFRVHAFCRPSSFLGGPLQGTWAAAFVASALLRHQMPCRIDYGEPAPGSAPLPPIEPSTVALLEFLRGSPGATFPRLVPWEVMEAGAVVACREYQDFVERYNSGEFSGVAPAPAPYWNTLLRLQKNMPGSCQEYALLAPLVWLAGVIPSPTCITQRLAFRLLGPLSNADISPLLLRATGPFVVEMLRSGRNLEVNNPEHKHWTELVRRYGTERVDRRAVSVEGMAELFKRGAHATAITGSTQLKLPSLGDLVRVCSTVVADEGSRAFSVTMVKALIVFATKADVDILPQERLVSPKTSNLVLLLRMAELMAVVCARTLTDLENSVLAYAIPLCGPRIKSRMVGQALAHFAVHVATFVRPVGRPIPPQLLSYMMNTLSSLEGCREEQMFVLALVVGFMALPTHLAHPPLAHAISRRVRSSRAAAGMFSLDTPSGRAELCSFAAHLS